MLFIHVQTQFKVCNNQKYNAIIKIIRCTVIIAITAFLSTWTKMYALHGRVVLEITSQFSRIVFVGFVGEHFHYTGPNDRIASPALASSKILDLPKCC